MTMMMMANQAEPLDSSCTNTKYMSWVWRKGLGRDGGKRLLHTAEDGGEDEHFLCFSSIGGLESINEQPGSSHFALFTVNSALSDSWSRALRII